MIEKSGYSITPGVPRINGVLSFLVVPSGSVTTTVRLT